MNVKIQTLVDQNFIDKAEEEAYQILLVQHGFYSEQWNLKIRPKLRLFGLVICLLGLMVCIATLVYLFVEYGNSACIDNTITEFAVYGIIFLIFSIVFYLLPKSQKIHWQWATKIANRNLKKIAEFCVKDAKKLAPFTAEYEFDGKSINYYRIKNDSKTLVWNRKLKGVAVHSSLITLFFKRWASVSPIMVILHQHDDLLAPILMLQEIESKNILTQS